MPDTVTARIPADTAHVAVLRAVATALAARLDFPVDRIIELQIAVDEICSRLMAVARSATRIEGRFEIRDDDLVLEASVDGERREDREILTDWSRVILQAIAEDVSPSELDGTTSLKLRVGKGAR